MRTLNILWLAFLMVKPGAAPAEEIAAEREAAANLTPAEKAAREQQARVAWEAANAERERLKE